MGTSDGTRVTRKIEQIIPDTVTVDSRVQRPLDQKRVDIIAAGFDPLALGVPTVSHRTNGTMIALDGQHRFAALKQLGRGNRAVPCTAYRGLSLQEEAALFALLNNTKKLNEVDLFRVSVLKGDPDSVAINDMVEENGMTFDQGHKNSFRAVRAICVLYRRDPVSAKRALLVCTAAWGPYTRSVHNNLVRGIGEVMYRHGEVISVVKLAEKLQKARDCEPGLIIGRARTTANLRGITIENAVADIIVNLWNKSRDTRKVPSWDMV